MELPKHISGGFNEMASQCTVAVKKVHKLYREKLNEMSEKEEIEERISRDSERQK